MRRIRSYRAESCGIVVNDGGVFVSHKDMGLDVLEEVTMGISTINAK